MTRAPLAGITVVAMEQAVRRRCAPACSPTSAPGSSRSRIPNGGDFARDYDDVVNGPVARRALRLVQPRQGVGHPQPEVPAGMDMLHRLLDRADAFVSNLAPGSTAPAGHRTRRPGRAPPERHPGRDRRLRAGRADVAQARLRPAGAGRIGLVRGHRRRRRARQARPADGRLHDRAVRRRCRSWRCCIRGIAGRRRRRHRPSNVSLFDIMTDVMGYQLTYTQHSGIDQQPLGVELARGRAVRRRFRTRDGQTVVLGTTNDREWQRLATGDHRSPRPGRRRAVPHQRRPVRAPRRSSTRRSDLVRPTRSRRDPEDRGRRGNRQLPLQPAERGGGAPAADRARPLAHGRHVRGATSRRCGRRR